MLFHRGGWDPTAQPCQSSLKRCPLHATFILAKFDPFNRVTVSGLDRRQPGCSSALVSNSMPETWERLTGSDSDALQASK